MSEETRSSYRKMAQLVKSVLRYGDQEFTVASIARKTGFLTQSVEDCLAVLIQQKFVEQAERTGYYRLTPDIQSMLAIPVLKSIYRRLEGDETA